MPSPLAASSLLVPGYVNPAAVEGLARFIARLDPSIPPSLLAFCPPFYLHDLPMISRDHAEDARGWRA